MGRLQCHLGGGEELGQEIHVVDLPLEVVPGLKVLDPLVGTTLDLEEKLPAAGPYLPTCRAVCSVETCSVLL